MLGFNTSIVAASKTLSFDIGAGTIRKLSGSGIGKSSNACWPTTRFAAAEVDQLRGWGFTPEFEHELDQIRSKR